MCVKNGGHIFRDYTITHFITADVTHKVLCHGLFVAFMLMQKSFLPIKDHHKQNNTFDDRRHDQVFSLLYNLVEQRTKRLI